MLFVIAALLGVVFLGIKAFEYATEYREGLLLTPVAAFAPQRVTLVENTGLFWHLVDAIWVFLYPVLYLAR